MVTKRKRLPKRHLTKIEKDALIVVVPVIAEIISGFKALGVV